MIEIKTRRYPVSDGQQLADDLAAATRAGAELLALRRDGEAVIVVLAEKRDVK